MRPKLQKLRPKLLLTLAKLLAKLPLLLATLLMLLAKLQPPLATLQLLLMLLLHPLMLLHPLPLPPSNFGSRNAKPAFGPVFFRLQFVAACYARNRSRRATASIRRGSGWV